MADLPGEHRARGLRRALVATMALELVAAAVALWLVRQSVTPLLPVRLQRWLAYAWVALTIGAAVAAYGLALSAPSARGDRQARARLLGAALGALAALAGIVIFCFVRAWPMLVVSLLVGFLGLVLGWPAIERPPAAPAAAEDAGAWR